MTHSQSSGRVLVVDDDASVRKVLAALLRQAGHAPVEADSGERALAELVGCSVDIVLTDLRMPGMDGMALLKRVAREWPCVPVVMITAHGTVPVAVEAMRAGAADFILKPFDREDVLHAVNKALATAAHLSNRIPAAPERPAEIVGDSPAMQQVDDMLRRVAGSRATVLIRGESGTGKELAARAVHTYGPRAERPFIVVHCAALPEALLESELFGYEKGAFTGAVGRKPGRVELAEGGTIMLDEVGEVPLTMQPKLLRLLQEGEYTPLGGTRSCKADVRFVAATHRNLESMVQEGTFREDLFYRLSVVPIRLPPLRERTSHDILALASHFCEVAGAQNGRPGRFLTASALSLLARQPWPGNVRELENFAERLVIVCDGPEIGEHDVQRELDAQATLSTRGSAPSSSADAASAGSLDAHRRDAERRALEDALARAGNNRTQAARILGVSRRTLYNKLAEHGIA